MSYRWRAFWVGAFYICFGATERSTWPVLLPSIADGFGIGVAPVAWTLVMFALGMAGSTLTTGRLGDLLGHRRMAVIGFAAEGTLLLTCAFMPTIWLILALRFFQGAAASSALSNCQAIMLTDFPREQRGRIIGLMGGTGAVGLLLGPLYAGQVTGLLGWRWAVGGLSMVMFTQALLTMAFIRAPSDRPAEGGARQALRSLSWRGAGLLLGSVAALLVAVQMLRLPAWRAWGGMLLALAAAGTAMVVAVERRAPNPVLRVDLFRSKAFSTACAYLVWTSLAFSGTQVLLPFFLQRGLGWTVGYTGVVLMALFAAQPIGSPVAGWASDRLGSTRVFIAGLAASAVGLAAGSRLDGSATTVQVIMPLLLYSLGMSLTGPALSRLVVRDVPRTALGSATAITVGTRYVGQGLGGALTAGILAAGAANAIPATFREGMVALAGLMVAGSAVIVAAPWVWTRVRGRARVEGLPPGDPPRERAAPR